ncbi:MAG: hypothetical protein HOP18_07450 [Deltaproteobacteria bacterium]|nr:hypothetical protein [Deltaproteobacteria bacterium]
MQKIKSFTVAATLVGALLGGATAWAGDTIRPIDGCGTLTARDQSSYILVNSIQTNNLNCLIIESSNITIDMNGFSIQGSGEGTGILAPTPVEGIKIRNGFVRNFAIGISLGGTGNVVEGVHVTNNTDTGMVLGASNLVDHVVAQANNRNGILMTAAATVKNSTLRANGSNPESKGLSVGPGSTVTGNTIWASVGTGLFASLGSTVIGNTVFDSNPGVGISVICPSNVQDNTATGNTIQNLTLNDGIGCNAVDNVAP